MRTAIGHHQEMVTRPGIEPSVGLPVGFTIRCRTLRRPAIIIWWEGWDSNPLTVTGTGLQPAAALQLDRLPKWSSPLTPKH